MGGKGGYPLKSISVILREAQESDLEDIIRLWHELMDVHARQDAYFCTAESAIDAYRQFTRLNIRNANSLILVAEIDGMVVGEILAKVYEYPPIYPRMSYIEILEIAVTQTYRRRGVGAKLVAAVLKHCREKGFHYFECSVSSANASGQCFWQKMGFREVMRRYYREES